MAIALAGTAAAAAVASDETKTIAIVPDAAPFGINIGAHSASGDVVAWVVGQSQCNNVILGPISDFLGELIGGNFCSRPFNLNDRGRLRGGSVDQPSRRWYFCPFCLLQ
ncbi:hypothetical protein C8J57DRAFT_1234514 [Mycena rebaudengoi]|nr:hypothetical protein C8J57DRAFT_1234514 [Mycena rebaudengoi]